MNHLDIKILGDVTGKGFANAANQQAEVFGIAGCAVEEEGMVIIEAEGQESNLKKFLEWCWQGPDQASVAEVKSEPGQLKNYRGFSVGKNKSL